MTQAAHTPGPWHVGDRNALLGTYIRDANGFCVAITNTPNNQRAYYIDEAANARLISAAPDMLAALVKVEKVLRDEGFPQTLRQVQNAISKATGAS